MDQSIRRRLAESEYLSYLEICLRKGESVTGFPSEDELKDVTDSDLLSATRRLKDLARTPTA